jgi:LemA protein
MWPLLIVLGVAVWLVLLYNGLVQLRESAEAAWSDIDVQLKRRYDLIPNLVETVKGYAKHERETLQGVIEARNQAMSAQGPAAKAQAEGQLAGALKSLFALSEAYPQLQAASGFRDLQDTLSEVETNLSQARRYYNAVVRDLNTRVQSFPSVFIARGFGFSQREFFEVQESERAVPRVSFGDDAS